MAPRSLSNGYILLLSVSLLLIFSSSILAYQIKRDYQWFKAASLQVSQHRIMHAKNLLVGYLCSHKAVVEKISFDLKHSEKYYFHYLPFPDRHTDELGYDQTGDVPTNLSFRFTANSTLGAFPYIATGIQDTSEPLGLIAESIETLWLAVAPKYLQRWSRQITSLENNNYTQLLQLDDGQKKVKNIVFMLILANKPTSAQQSRTKFSEPKQFLEASVIGAETIANYDPADFTYISNKSSDLFNDKIYWVTESDLPSGCTNPQPFK